MHRVIGVRFKQAGKIYYFDPGDIKLNKGDVVIVETIRGIEHGTVIIEESLVGDEEIVSPLKKVIRKATEQDLKHIKEQKDKEAKAAEICRQKIAARELPMKLINVEYTFDDNKIIFNFTAEGRIDFRELVKDLAAVFRTRIELRQIGIRDEAKTLGGLGCCGQELCCKRWLVDFNPVSIKMAKTQNLSLNTTKISGTCSRLMCCLKYENDVYEEFKAGYPKEGTRVMTPVGEGRVTEANVFSQKITVELNTSKISRDFDLNELVILQGNESGADIAEELAAEQKLLLAEESINGKWLSKEEPTTTGKTGVFAAEGAQHRAISPEYSADNNPDDKKETENADTLQTAEHWAAATEANENISAGTVLKNSAARYAREGSSTEDPEELFDTEVLVKTSFKASVEKTSSRGNSKYTTAVRRNRNRRSDGSRTTQVEHQDKQSRPEKKERTEKTPASVKSDNRDKQEKSKKVSRQDKTNKNERSDKTNRNEKYDNQVKNNSKNKKLNNNKQTANWTAEKNNDKGSKSGDKKRNQETGDIKGNNNKAPEEKHPMKNTRQNAGNHKQAANRGKDNLKTDKPIEPNSKKTAAGNEAKENKGNSKKAPWYHRAIGKKDNNK